MVEKVGIKKIAELSGVSIGTVDRVLNNRKGVSKETAKHIRAVIKHTGYKKNNVASRLKLAQNKTISICVLFPKEAYLEEHYWNLPLKGVNKAVAELSEMGITHDLHVFEIGSSKSFKKESQKILSKKPHAIITVPFFTSQSIELTKKAEELNIPVVFIDTKKADEIDSKYSIHQNSFKSGKVAARILSQIIRTNGQFIIINVINDLAAQKNNMERESGFKTFFDKQMSNKKKTIHSITVEQSKINTLKQLFEPFSHSKEPIGIFVTNSKAYLLPELLDDIGFNTDRIIIGYDLNRGNIKLLEENKIQFIINQQPEYQGYSAVKGLFKMITEDDDADLYQKIPIEIVVRENIE